MDRVHGNTQLSKTGVGVPSSTKRYKTLVLLRTRKTDYGNGCETKCFELSSEANESKCHKGPVNHHKAP